MYDTVISYHMRTHIETGWDIWIAEKLFVVGSIPAADTVYRFVEIWSNY